ncbi:MAG: hypothetical protein C5B60_05335, partial [Chloroflexi bacterium]
ALALSEWLEMTVSATFAYGVWVALVVIQMTALHSAHQVSSVSTTSSVEVVLGLAGMLLLFITLGRMRALTTQWLPRA